MKIEVSPSILSADFSKLGEEIREMEPYSDRIHFDVMDGHFVPNISFGAPVLKWVKSRLPIDAHLMIENPEKYVEDFVKAGATTVIVHQEACGDLGAVLKQIADLGAKRGVSVKPGTPVEVLKDFLGEIDYVLIMTVEPGFGGQDFLPEQVEKVKKLREWGYAGDIAVDGGINAETGSICREAGANILIAGNYIFKSEDKKTAVSSLRG